MKKEEKTPYQEVVYYFGSVQKLATALDTTRQAIYLWSGIIPEGRAYQIEVITEGELKASNILERQKCLKAS